MRKGNKQISFACATGHGTFKRLLAAVALLFAAEVTWAEENSDQDALMQTLVQVRANFQAADADRDDALVMQELRVFVDASAEIDFAILRRVKRMRAYRQAFQIVDADKDGVLGWDDYEYEYETMQRSRGSGR